MTWEACDVAAAHWPAWRLRRGSRCLRLQVLPFGAAWLRSARGGPARRRSQAPLKALVPEEAGTRQLSGALCSL